MKIIILSFLNIFLFNSLSQAQPIKSCGRYHITGQLKKIKDDEYILMVYPGKTSQIELKLIQKFDLKNKFAPRDLNYFEYLPVQVWGNITKPTVNRKGEYLVQRVEFVPLDLKTKNEKHIVLVKEEKCAQ